MAALGAADPAEGRDRCVAPEVVQELVVEVQAEVGNDWALRRLDESGG